MSSGLVTTQHCTARLVFLASLLTHAAAAAGMTRIIGRFKTTLQHPDLSKPGRDGNRIPLISDHKFATMMQKWSTRCRLVKPSVSTITITERDATRLHAKYVQGKLDTLLSGEKMKALLVVQPFVLRDLAYDEVKFVKP